MDPSTFAPILSALRMLSPWVAAIVVLAALLVTLARMFKADVGSWISADGAAKLAHAQAYKGAAEVSAATLERISSQVASVAPTVVGAVIADNDRTRDAVETVGEGLTSKLDGLTTLTARLQRRDPTPPGGVVIPPDPPAAPAAKASP